MLALAQHDRADGQLARVLERVAQERVALRGEGSLRRDVVRIIEVEVRHVGGRHELADLERLRAGYARALEVLVRQDDVLIRRVLIAPDDVLPGDLDVLFLAEALFDDAAAVFLVQKVEGQRLARFGRRDQVDRYGHEPEADGALPECAWWHAVRRQQPVCHPPARRTGISENCRPANAFGARNHLGAPGASPDARRQPRRESETSPGRFFTLGKSYPAARAAPRACGRATGGVLPLAGDDDQRVRHTPPGQRERQGRQARHELG